jgi:hypothetical protein
MAQSRHLQDLADELLTQVLYFLVPSQPKAGPGIRAINGGSYKTGVKQNGIDRRSFGFGEGSDLDRFRLVCTRFMRIGTPRKFSHFNLRFSKEGFRRLDELLQMQLACYVKSMTYLVRPFYQGNCKHLLMSSQHPSLFFSEAHAQTDMNIHSLGTDFSFVRCKTCIPR